DLGPLLIVHGGFLLAFVPYLAGRAYGTTTLPRERLIGIAAAGVVLLLALWLGGFAVVALFGPLLAAAWFLLRRRADVGFETVLMLAGIGLVLIVEFAYVIEPQYSGTQLERMNTVFKTYMQVWVLWAPAAGVALARLVDPSNALPSLDTPAWRAAGVAIACVALLTTGLYAGFAVPAHFGNQPTGADGPTLDGMAYTYERYPDEARAIDWLNAREGQPTIVTAAPGGYRWNPDDGKGASAPASLTGVPTVLGWFHEEQYRGEEPYQERLTDVETIYEGPHDGQSALLDQYDVEYVYVGPAERARYDLTIESHPNLEVAFREGEVVIYEVEG
ncbi:MAG: YYY domain-containing protein, partial [Natronomonas sp.]